MLLSRRAFQTQNPDFGSSSLYVLAKRKYDKNYVKKVKTDSGEVRVYDEAHVKKRWKKKVDNINSLKSKLPKLQKKYKSDLSSDDLKVRTLAAVVAVIDMTAMRVGNDDSVDEFGTFGATTLKKKHVKISGNTVRFKFLGKKKVEQDLSLTDSKVAKVIKELISGKSANDFVFEYDDGKRIRAKVVNRYLADFGITAKDLRGFHANRLMREELKRTKDFDRALEEVSESVGHEPKTLMNQYLDPSLVKKYKKAEFDLINYIESELSKILGGGGRSQGMAMAPVAPSKSRDGDAAELAGRQRVTSPYGERIDPITKKPGHFHKGIDLAARIGAKVFAFESGTVTYAGDTKGAGGITIKIAHDKKGETVTMYMHLNEVMVSAGQSVRRGQLIGLAGKTGDVTGPHLHFVIKTKSGTVNPAPYLKDRLVVEN
jgi:murein DD-endopeptidase MepM/ murein hydrolase activator NlpD